MKPSTHTLVKRALLFFVGSFVLTFLVDIMVTYGLDHAVNNGLVFGTLPYNIYAIFLSVIFLALLLYLAPRSTERDYTTLGLCGGAVISNVVERAIFGGVIDYAPLFAGIHFNLADIIIVVTVVLIFYRKLTI